MLSTLQSQRILCLYPHEPLDFEQAQNFVSIILQMSMKGIRDATKTLVLIVSTTSSGTVCAEDFRTKNHTHHDNQILDSL